jgi:hypothetical protein
VASVHSAGIFIAKGNSTRTLNDFFGAIRVVVPANATEQ